MWKPDKKNTASKRKLKKSATEYKKLTKAVCKAWADAGYPKEGITYEGQHFRPLDFGDSWPVAKAAKAGK